MNQPLNYVFAGNAVTFNQFLALKADLERGLCPFCKRQGLKSGAKQHVRACKSNPVNLPDGKRAL